ncbi:hypothetical protein QBC39DRAFT_334979 [Podospora conica]|nr:hypothetical protein QBC39DRAFT_334979 [Schizothecium conicum]
MTRLRRLLSALYEAVILFVVTPRIYFRISRPGYSTTAASSPSGTEAYPIGIDDSDPEYAPESATRVVVNKRPRKRRLSNPTDPDMAAKVPPFKVAKYNNSSDRIVIKPEPVND